MYHVSAQGVDERMINVHYYYYNPANCQGISLGWSLLYFHCIREEIVITLLIVKEYLCWAHTILNARLTEWAEEINDTW